MIKEINKIKGDLKMTELETLMLDVTNTLNHNGFDEIKVVSNNTNFSLRAGYWDRISASLIETMEEYHNVRITETFWDDEDCGTLYRYLVEVIDEESGYTPDELNELDSYTEEALYLESVGADNNTWGNA